MLAGSVKLDESYRISSHNLSCSLNDHDHVESNEEQIRSTTDF